MNKLVEQVVARRQAWARRGQLADGARLWGLALSGGGIRSATFCFGLLRALAHERILLRFDLLSTVSGGGYIGAMLGRLFSRAASPRDAIRVQQALADARSNWFVWWLRANGRYLIPRGARDLTFVVALYIRNLVAIHFELGLIALMLGIVLCMADLGAWTLADRLAFHWPTQFFAVLQDLPGWAPLWFPVTWLALPLVVLAGASFAAAYWIVPWVHHYRRWVALAWVVVAVCATQLVRIYLQLDQGASPVGEVMRTTLWAITAVLIGLWLIGVPLGVWVLRRLPAAVADSTGMQKADAARTYLTRSLAQAFRWFSFVAMVGLIDRCAWFLAFELEPLTETGQGAAALWLASAAAAIRAALPLASRLMPGRGSTHAVLMLGRVLGYALTFMLCVWWVSLVQKAALGAVFTNVGLALPDGWMILGLFALPMLVFVGVTSRNVEFLNLSSLHAFYQARIVRSYLGAANGARFGAGKSPLAQVPAVAPAGQRSRNVDDIFNDDDVRLADYQPQRCGGPVHVVNVCINQTRDPRGGLFNQDRRGLALSVASGGLHKVSQSEWTPVAGDGALTLGSWIAISGAAIAPGLGSLTRGGISALATFAGVRLGYWWDKAARTGTGKPWHQLFSKSCGVLSETFGVFKGTDDDDWFLTDGGHFENTAAYALLAERAEVIVLADCGADPHYKFEDLENLVRKARIDLQAEILFQRPRARDLAGANGAATLAGGKYRAAAPPTPDAPPEGLARFGSLNDLASPTSSACLALAKIHYGGDAPGYGILIVIKPNLCAGLPVDLVNFKRQTPDFPQETTADQFFSEAQWESYFHLGAYLGQHLDRKFVGALLRNSDRFFENDDRSPFETASAGHRRASDGTAPAATSRLPSRIGDVATAMGTTLSLGAAATVAVAAWQAIETTKTSYVRQKADERAALKELTDLWARATSPSASAPAKPDGPATGALAAALLRTADTLCPTNEARWFTESDLARRIHATAIWQCGQFRQTGMATPAACTALLSTAGPTASDSRGSCLSPAPEILAVQPPPRYWAYDYTGAGNATNAHPCDPVVAQRRKLDSASGGPLFEPPPATCRYTGRFAGGLYATAPAVSVPATPASGAASAPAPPQPGASATQPAAPAESAPAATDATVVSHECDGVTVFLQIYGAAQRSDVASYRRAWRSMGAEVPRAEDVVDTANARGYASPTPVTTTTVRFHDASSISCAQALGPRVGMTGWTVEPLSAKYRPRANTVEVWVAPNAATAAQVQVPMAQSAQDRPPPIPRSRVPE